MKKILIIEDEPSVRENLIKLLKAEKFEVFGAEDGLAGVQMAVEQVPDLILCDVMMPGLDGYGVLKALRENTVTMAIPFIFLTAKASRADLRQGMELGADDYLTKPFTRKELMGAIATRLNRHEEQAKRFTVALQTAAEQLNRLAYYDSVTNLPNRLLLRELFNQVCQTSQANQSLISLLALGLERFHWINNNLGYSFSNILLKTVADRLLNLVEQPNILARLESDQFIIILSKPTTQAEVIEIAENILKTLSDPFQLGIHEVFVAPSLGITFYGRDGEDLDQLVKNAQSAQYNGQRTGGNSYQIYRGDLNADSYENLLLEAELHRALSRDEFEVYYQPKINLQTNRITGAEALIRWNHPERGLTSPAKFMPIAEKTGLIIPIGEWVFKQTCLQSHLLWEQLSKTSSTDQEPVKIAVNLSAKQFNQPDLKQRIIDCLQTTGLDPYHLELELTESTLVRDPEGAIAILTDLKDLGIDIAIDDFGTGYASLSYLTQFPFDTLKIDRSFVSNVTRDSKNAAIATAIIQMAHSLNLKVVAEGVETEDEKAFLHQNQCDEMQGYLFSRPLPINAFQSLLLAHSQ